MVRQIYILEHSGLLFSDIKDTYLQTANLLINEAKNYLMYKSQRIHGDFHKSIILER